MSWLSFDVLVCWQITQTLLHVSWIGLVIGVIAACANRVLKKSSASRRYSLNFAMLLVFSASLPVALAVVRIETAEAPVIVVPPRAGVRERANLSPPSVEEPVSGLLQGDAPKNSVIPPQTPSAAETVIGTVPSTANKPLPPSVWEDASSIGHAAGPFVAVLYVMGVVVMFVKLAFGLRVSRRLRIVSQPVSDAHILARLADQGRKLSLRIVPVIAYCELAAVPIVVGLLRPMILIPTAMINGLTMDQLECVLTHELAHLKRLDHLMIVVQRVLEAILFFHPVTWYLSNRLHDDRETSCDDLVLSIGGDRLQYAQSLLRVAELRFAGQSRQKHVALAADGQRPSKLRQRIARLLGDSERESVRLSSVWLLSIVSALLIAGIATLSNSDRPAFAAVQEDIELSYDSVLNLASKAYENPPPIVTAYVKFQITDFKDGFQEGLTSKKCRQLLSTSGVTSQPDKLKNLLGLLMKEPERLVSKPWTHVELYQGESGIRTTTSSSSHGPDYWVAGQWSYRWDSAKSQASLLRREDDRFHNDETLDEFLRHRKIILAHLKYQEPSAIRREGDRILLEYNEHPELQQEMTLDAVSGRLVSAANSSHGTVFQERLLLGWRAFDDDIWLPAVIAEFRYRQGELDDCRLIVIEDASFNQTLPQGVFSFSVPAGAVVEDKRVGLCQTYTISRKVEDVTSDEQLEAARAPLSDESVDMKNPGLDAERILYSADDVDLIRIGQEVLQKLEKETGDFLNNSQRQQLVSDLRKRLSERVSVRLAPQDFDNLLSAIRNSARGNSGIKFSRLDTFMINFAVLEWRIRVGMDPLKLTPEDVAKRENQRDWFRAYISAQPAPHNGRQVYSSKSGKRVELTFREYDQLQYEELLGDPTYPFLFFPFSDDEFAVVKASLQTTPSDGFASESIYDEYEKAHLTKVEQRWPYSDGKGLAIWGNGTGYLKGFADETVADADIPDPGPLDAELETRKQDQTVEAKVYVAPPKDSLAKLLGANIDLNAVRRNAAGLQYTSIGPVQDQDQDWEPIALEEAFDVVLSGMKQNFEKIKTWSGECQEVIVTRDKSVMKERSHLVRFELDVHASKGGAVQTTSKDWSCPASEFDTQTPNVSERLAPSGQVPDADQEFRSEAIFYTPFFFGRQNELHWDRIANYLEHFRDTETPESERFAVAYRAKDPATNLWRIDTVLRGIDDKLLISQTISEAHGFNVLRETSVFVQRDGKTFLYEDVLQSYSESDGVFVPAERLIREFEPRTDILRGVHLQRITRSVVNHPLDPLPVLAPEPSKSSEFAPVEDESTGIQSFRRGT